MKRQYKVVCSLRWCYSLENALSLGACYSLSLVSDQNWPLMVTPYLLTDLFLHLIGPFLVQPLFGRLPSLAPLLRSREKDEIPHLDAPAVRTGIWLGRQKSSRCADSPGNYTFPPTL